MRVIRWARLGGSAVVLVAYWVMRGLMVLGATSAGITASEWLMKRGEHWWEGAAPTKSSAPQWPIAAAGAEPGTLGDPALLRKLRSLRGSQDLPRMGEIPSTYTDAAPDWHPERRPENSD